MVTLLAAAFVAALLLARRAASIDPTDALRNESEVSSAGTMSGTVTGTSDQPSEKWSAEKKK